MEKDTETDFASIIDKREISSSLERDTGFKPETGTVCDNVIDAGRGGPVRQDRPIKPGTLSEQIKRRDTFDKHNWSVRNRNIDPDLLAEAGFFYEGVGDTVRCQYCDGTLCKWEPGDDPLKEHRKWYPACLFASME